MSPSEKAAQLRALRRIANELKSAGTHGSFPEDTIPSPEANRLFGGPR
jgi:hypothetical protein